MHEVGATIAGADRSGPCPMRRNMAGKGRAVNRRRRKRRASIGDWLVAVVILAVIAWSFVPALRAWADAAWRDASARVSEYASQSGVPDSAPTSEHMTRLEALSVRDSADGGAPDYSREAFGQAWADEDHNGCDTRNDILKRDLARPTFKAGTHDCVVLSGTLAEPYTGTVIEFERGQDTSALVQIDHVVALGDAWSSGAWAWDAATRQRFANDPANLLAVDGQANEDKSASSADQWLPPNREFRCEYVERQIDVKTTWGLSVTAAEREAMASVLHSCPAQG